MLKVYLKELLELTRDKKTLLFTILLPTFIMPVLMFGFIALASSLTKKAVDEELNYAVIGAENYQALATELAKNDKLKLVEIDPESDIKTLINDKVIRFVIKIPEDTQSRMQQGLSAEIEMMFNDSGTSGTILYSRVTKSLKEFSEAKKLDRFLDLGLTEEQGAAVNDPINIVKKTIADKRESVGEAIGSMLPYILILIGFSGAMYPAIDLGVGEKERGTLETLLLTPVPRFQLVFAKFLVIFTTSFISVFLSLISFGLTAIVFGPMMIAGIASGGGGKITELMNALSTITFFDVSLMFLMLVPVAAIFASLLLSISIYARSFKEAQNYMSPMMIVVLFPLILPMLPGVKLDWVWASVPITNVSLAIKEIFKGTIDLNMLTVIFVSTTIIAGLLLALCNWWFQREQVLFRN